MRKANLFTLSMAIATSLLLHETIAQSTVVSVAKIGKKKAGEYVVGACGFRIGNMFGGRFYIPDHSDPLSQQGIYDFPDTGAMAPHVLRSFGLFCQSAGDDEVGLALGAKQVDGKWLQYDPPPGSAGLSPFDRNANPQTVTLKGSNWTGIGLTVDATTGDEEKRPRVFSFCLIHKAQALCGNTPVVWLADPKHNDLWMVKSILQSVVFSDSPVPASVNTASGTSAPAK